MVSKTIKNHKLSSPIYNISLLFPCDVVLRSFRFMSFGPNPGLYISNQRQFSIVFKDNVNINIRGQIPIKFLKGTKMVYLGSTSKTHHFKILLPPMWLGFSKGHKNEIHFIKRQLLQCLIFKGFSKEMQKNPIMVSKSQEILRKAQTNNEKA